MNTFESGKKYESKVRVNGYAIITGVEKNSGNKEMLFEYHTETGREYEVPESDFWQSYYKEDEEEESSKPAHYDTAIDTLAFAKANFSREQVEGFMRINAVKYLQRDKGQKLSDLKKCATYVQMLIELEEEQG